VQRGIFGPKEKEVTEEWRKLYNDGYHYLDDQLKDGMARTSVYSGR
jgi:hypothetical protein